MSTVVCVRRVATSRCCLFVLPLATDIEFSPHTQTFSYLAREDHLDRKETKSPQYRLLSSPTPKRKNHQPECRFSDEKREDKQIKFKVSQGRNDQESVYLESLKDIRLAVRSNVSLEGRKRRRCIKSICRIKIISFIRTSGKRRENLFKTRQTEGDTHAGHAHTIHTVMREEGCHSQL